MDAVTVTLGGQNITITGADRRKIEHFAGMINKKLEDIKQANPSINVMQSMCLLMMLLQEEIEDLRNKIQDSSKSIAQYQHQVELNGSLIQMLENLVNEIEDLSSSV